MKKFRILTLIATFALALMVAPATFAEEAPVITESTILEALVTSQETPEDIFRYEDNLTTSEIINSSAFYAGLNLDDSSTINGIGWFAGNSVKLNGAYDYGVAVGNVLDINGTYSNDLFLAGSTINIEKEASLGRNAYIAADTIQLKTNVPGSAYFFANTIAIADGTTISGNLSLNANSISFGDNVTIKGTLTYNENANVANLSSVTVGETKTYTIVNTTESTNNRALSLIASFCFSLLSYLLFVLVFAAICPHFFRKLREKTAKNYAFKQGIADFGIGLAILLFVPLVLIFALITIIGIPVVIIFALLYIFALYASSMVTGYFIGNKILGRGKKPLPDKRINHFLTAALGIAILSIVELIPGINILVGLIVICFGIGLSLRTIFYNKKK